MRSWAPIKRSLGLSLALSAGVLSSVVLAADTAAVEVGDSTFSSQEIEARLRRVPPFQLRSFGDTPKEIKMAFVEEIVKAELLAQGAREAGLQHQPDVSDRIRAVYVSALLERLRQRAEEAGEVSDDEVRAYYEANKERYETQKRIKIWQIVVDSQPKVEAIYDVIESDAYAADPVGTWDELARKHSIDKTTAMRKGNIGFVQPDGSTAHKDVRVPKEMYEVASKLGDGEVVDKPLKVGDYFVIVQRRSSITTPERSLASEAETIRGMLSKRKVAARRRAVLAGLREQYVEELNPRAVDAIEVTPAGEIGQKARPGTLPRSTRDPGGAARPSGPPGRMR